MAELQNRPRSYTVALSLLPYFCLLSGAYFFFGKTEDDPFITFRYAANVLAGNGAVFNPGERVEGFSSPLHLAGCVLLLKIFPLLGILFKAKIASVLFACLMIFQTGRLAKQFGLTASQSFVAQFLLSLNINLSVSATNGLETTLYGALLLTFLRQFVMECRVIRLGSANRRASWFSGLLLFLALLARPETLVLFTAMVPVRLWMTRRNEKATLSELSCWLAVFTIPTVAFLALRHAYYGLFLPNTYYAKHMVSSHALLLGAAYVFNGLFWEASHVYNPLKIITNSYLLLNSLGILYFWGLAILGAKTLSPRENSPVLFAPLLTTLAFILLSGGDWMKGWRFMIAVLPLFAILQSVALDEILAFAARVPRIQALVSRTTVYTLIALLHFLIFLRLPHFAWKTVHFSTEDADLLVFDNTGYPKLWGDVGRYIQASFPPGSVIAYSEMGYGTYLNPDKRFLDLRGLISRDIAAAPSRFKSKVGVVDTEWDIPGDVINRVLEERKPDALITFDGDKSMPSKRLLGYRFLKTIPSTEEFVCVFVRSESAAERP